VELFQEAERVRGLQGGDDPLRAREPVEPLQGRVVVDGDRVHAPLVDEVRELWADAGVVEAGGSSGSP